MAQLQPKDLQYKINKRVNAMLIELDIPFSRVDKAASILERNLMESYLEFRKLEEDSKADTFRQPGEHLNA